MAVPFADGTKTPFDEREQVAISWAKGVFEGPMNQWSISFELAYDIAKTLLQQQARAEQAEAALNAINDQPVLAEYDVRCDACGHIMRVNLNDNDEPEPYITDLTWADACDELMAGSYVRLSHWEPGRFLYISPDTDEIYNDAGEKQAIYLIMLESTNWESWKPEDIRAKKS